MSKDGAEKRVKDEFLSVRADSQMKHDLMELAQSQDRSLSNFIQHILKQHIAAEKKKR